MGLTIATTTGLGILTYDMHRQLNELKLRVTDIGRVVSEIENQYETIESRMDRFEKGSVEYGIFSRDSGMRHFPEYH